MCQQLRAVPMRGTLPSIILVTFGAAEEPKSGANMSRSSRNTGTLIEGIERTI
jgi:hypothetical protein